MTTKVSTQQKCVKWKLCWSFPVPLQPSNSVHVFVQRFFQQWWWQKAKRRQAQDGRSASQNWRESHTEQKEICWWIQFQNVIKQTYSFSRGQAVHVMQYLLCNSPLEFSMESNWTIFTDRSSKCWLRLLWSLSSLGFRISSQNLSTFSTHTFQVCPCWQMVDNCTGDRQERPVSGPLSPRNTFEKECVPASFAAIVTTVGCISRKSNRMKWPEPQHTTQATFVFVIETRDYCRLHLRIKEKTIRKLHTSFCFFAVPYELAMKSNSLEMTLQANRETNFLNRVMALTSLFTFFNSCLNPVLYAFLSK